MSATLLLLLTATACGSRGTDGSSPAASNSGGGADNSGSAVSSNSTVSATSTASSGILPPPTGGPPTQPNQASPDSRAVNLKPARWSRAEAGPGPRLLVHYTAAGVSQCNLLGRVDVAETATTVTVTVLVGQAPGADCGGIQPMIAVSYVTAVTLHAPLGARTVKDGAA